MLWLTLPVSTENLKNSLEVWAEPPSTLGRETTLWQHELGHRTSQPSLVVIVSRGLPVCLPPTSDSCPIHCRTHFLTRCQTCVPARFLTRFLTRFSPAFGSVCDPFPPRLSMFPHVPTFILCPTWFWPVSDPFSANVFNRRKPKAESRKSIENEPRGHSGDHYSEVSGQEGFWSESGCRAFAEN